MLSSTADSLPVELLSLILGLSIESYEGETSCGGTFSGWDSNELVAPLASVARSWRASAEEVLYRSISCVGPARTNSLLATLRSRPELASRVRKLAIGLGPEREIERMTFAARKKLSIKLVELVELCPKVEHLQVRALHRDSWDRLSAVVHARPLKTLVASPRVIVDVEGWHEPSSQMKEIFWAHPTLETMEIEHNWIEQAELVPVELDDECKRLPAATSSSPPAPISLPLAVGGGGFPRLRSLRVHSFMPAEMLFHLIGSAGKTLQRLDVYTEAAPGPAFDRAFVAAMIPCLSSLRELRFVSNAPLEIAPFDPDARSRRVLDALLPHFHQLESLCASTADLSPVALERLPRGLKHIRVEVFRPFSFSCNPLMMIHALRDARIDLKDLQTITIGDEDDEVWAELNGPAEEAAAARGILFRRLGEADSGNLDEM